MKHLAGVTRLKFSTSELIVWALRLDNRGLSDQAVKLGFERLVDTADRRVCFRDLLQLCEAAQRSIEAAERTSRERFSDVSRKLDALEICSGLPLREAFRRHQREQSEDSAEHLRSLERQAHDIYRREGPGRRREQRAKELEAEAASRLERFRNAVSNRSRRRLARRDANTSRNRQQRQGGPSKPDFDRVLKAAKQEAPAA